MKKNDTWTVLIAVGLILGIFWYMNLPKEPATGIPPTPDKPGIYEPGETFTQVLSYTPTQTIIADEDDSDGKVKLIKKAISVLKYGETTPRKYFEESITPQLSSGVKQEMSIPYTIPTTEPVGAFGILFVVTQVDGTLDSVTRKWTWSTTTIGSDARIIYIKDFAWDPAEISQKIQEMLLLLINQICMAHPGWCS